MKNYIVVIYGGIGSGKSQALNYLKSLGANVLSADDENRRLFEDPQYVEEIKKLFPVAIEGQKINKSVIKQIIFSDPDKKQALEILAHDRIRESLLNKVKDGLYFIEIPLYIDNYIPANETWVIKSRKSIKIKRILQRDEIDKNLAKRIISSQPKIKAKKAIIIHNNSSLESFRNKVLKYYYSALSRFEKQASNNN